MGAACSGGGAKDSAPVKATDPAPESSPDKNDDKDQAPGQQDQLEEKAPEDMPKTAKSVIQNLVPNSKRGEMLANVPLLLKLRESDRDKLGGAMEEEEFQDGTAVFSQGDASDKFYIIVEGTAIVKQLADNGPETEIGKLSKGDYFGEASLLDTEDGDKRGASVYAEGPLMTLWLARDKFQTLFGNDAFKVNFVSRARKGVSAEKSKTVVGASPGSVDDKALVKPADADCKKTDAQKELCAKALSQTVLCHSFDTEHINKIVEEMWCEAVAKGASVMKQGDHGVFLYVIEEGKFGVYIKEDPKADDTTSQEVSTEGPGGAFGELALMYNAPRAATVTALEESIVWKIDRYTFRRVAKDTGKDKLDTYTGFLSKVELLAALTSFERGKIAEALDEVQVKAGEQICKQGDNGDSMFIVKSGVVGVVKTTEGADETLDDIKVGDYFGERALLSGEPRAATVTAKEDVVLLKLDASAFHILLGPLQTIMEARVKGYTEPEEGEEKDETQENQRDVYKWEDLEVLGTLGQGSFGHVVLVKHKPSGDTFARKGVSKQQIVDTHQQGHIMSEKKVMSTLQHPFIIRLFATYKDDDQLYFLLEPVLGGELFTVLRKCSLFKEPAARFYAGSVILAFEYLHSKNTVYRDLKPENLLLDSHGYIKVADFGFAKKIQNKTWTLCGTPEYLCPEIVSGEGHGKGVDWWTVGILIYEMMASYTPFYHQNQLKMYDKIVRGRYKFPSHFSAEAKAIISAFLQHKPTQRLGVTQGEATEIKKHAWFTGFDWEKLAEKKFVAPVQPEIKDNLDMSNFEFDEPEARFVPAYEDDGSQWDADF